MVSESGWREDPFGRFDYRYFDGTEWTDRVSTGGAVTNDPPTRTPPPVGQATSPDQPVSPQASESGATLPPPVPAEQASSADQDHAGGPWWQRRVVLIIGGVAALVGLAGLVVGGVALAGSSPTRSDADSIAAEAETVEGEVSDVEYEGYVAEQRFDELDAAMIEYADAVFSFELFTDLATAAQNEVAAAQDAAVERQNAGAVQEGKDIARGRGTEALDAYQVALDDQLEALSDLQLTVNDLKEVVDGD